MYETKGSINKRFSNNQFQRFKLDSSLKKKCPFTGYTCMLRVKLENNLGTHVFYDLGCSIVALEYQTVDLRFLWGRSLCDFKSTRTRSKNFILRKCVHPHRPSQFLSEAESRILIYPAANKYMYLDRPPCLRLNILFKKHPFMQELPTSQEISPSWHTHWLQLSSLKKSPFASSEPSSGNSFSFLPLNLNLFIMCCL